MASSSVQDVVFSASLLPEISEFLDVASTVRLSQTCRALHASLTQDPDPVSSNAFLAGFSDHGDGGRRPDPKIKIAHFRLGDPSLLRAGPAGPRATSVAARAIPQLCFPFLKSAEFRLPSDVSLEGDAHAPRDAFLGLADRLENAAALEELDVDVGLFMESENDKVRMRTIYVAFADVLVRCAELRRIRVLNCLGMPSGRSDYSAGFLRALVPAVERGAGTLEEVSLQIGTDPVNAEAFRKDRACARDLLGAILGLRRLRAFHLQVDPASGLLGEFLRACRRARRGSGALPCPAMETFVVAAVPPDPPPAPLSLAPMLGLLGNSSNLRKLWVNVPSACWDSRGISALEQVLSSKPQLCELGLHFNGYKCNTGRTLELLLNYVRERERCEDNLIRISGLQEGQTETSNAVEALEMYYGSQGEECLRWDGSKLVFEATGVMIYYGRR